MTDSGVMHPNTTPDSIREMMVQVCLAVIYRRLDTRAKYLAKATRLRLQGDRQQAAGHPIPAAISHREAIRCLESAAEESVVILEICAEFGLESPDELTGAGWAPVFCHSGVGEGDAGIPAAAGVPEAADSHLANALNPRPQGGTAAGVS